MVRGQVCYQRPHNGGLGMPDRECHWFAERFTLLGRSLTAETVWKARLRWILPIFRQTPWLKAAVSQGVKQCCLSRTVRSFVSSDHSWPRKELYCDLVVVDASDPIVEWLGWSPEEIHSQWNWVSGSHFLNNSFTWRLARNALPFRA